MSVHGWIIVVIGGLAGACTGTEAYESETQDRPAPTELPVDGGTAETAAPPVVQWDPDVVPERRGMRHDASPSPIIGGTLLVTRDGELAVIADPDRDRLYVIDVGERLLRGTVALLSGDEPGRVAEDDAGRVHVVLRRAGAVVAFDPRALAIVDRRAVCVAPRGVAYDSLSDSIHVACLGGELLTLPASGGAATRQLRLHRDLRDVLVQGDRLLVTRFREAEVLVLDESGRVIDRLAPEPVLERTGVTKEASVAWRMVPSPGGGVMVLHQRASGGELQVQRTGYGGGTLCQVGIVETTLTELLPTGETRSGGALNQTVLGVDLAISPDGTEVVVAAPGNTGIGQSALKAFSNDSLGTPCVRGRPVGPTADIPRPGFPGPGEDSPAAPLAMVAVAFAPDGQLIGFSREPAVVTVGEARIELGESSSADEGHRLFHTGTPSFVACASCHPEGADDGRLWDFAPTGARRTQSLLGGILATAPFHWGGDKHDMQTVMEDTFSDLMRGEATTRHMVGSLERWLDAQPHPSVNVPDRHAVDRGRTLFEDVSVSCSGCHAGDFLTNNETVDVGTGGRFQVPSLRGITHRAPYMHDGRAATLRETLEGPLDRHGRISHLSERQLTDLLAYLESL